MRAPVWIGVLAIVVVVGAIGTGLVYAFRDPKPLVAALAARSLDIQNAAGLPPGNGMPVVYIEPIRMIGASASGSMSAERLHAKISDAFARFDTINVASSSTPSDAPGFEPRIDYRLSGTVEYLNGAPSAWFTLSSSAEGKVVWSRTFERALGGDDNVTEDGIVVSLTNSLLQSYGVIRARDRANQLATNAGDPRYRCVLEAADAIRTSDRKTHDLARACLEQLTVLDPSFAVGFSFLSLIYNREFQQEYALQPGDDPPLDRALRAVRQSIVLHPESSRGYLALMVIQFNRRDVAASFAAGDKCMTLNKYDMLALGEYGGRVIMAGNVDKGMAMLRDAGAHGAVRPAWHHIYMFIGSYMAGDTAGAVRHASDIAGDDVPLGQVARALAGMITGNLDASRKAVERLTALGPGWRSDPRAELARLIADPRIVDRLARDLAPAGLPGGV